MTHLYKALGLALIAVFVASAALASEASASQGEFIAEGGYPAMIDGTPVGGQPNALTVAGYSIECNESSFGGKLTKQTTSLTLNPAYANCHTEGFEFSNVNITENGCAYIINLGEGSVDKWASTVKVECPTGKNFVVHVYFDKNHEIEICRIEIPAQEGIAGLTLTNVTTPGKLEMEGEFKGLKYTQVGSQCGISEPENGVRHITALLSGTTEAGKPNRLVIK